MENTEKSGPSFGARVLAAVVLAIGAWILFKVIIGVVAAVAWFVVAVVAIIAVIWAVRTLFQVPFLVICFFFGLAGGVVGKIKGSSFFLWFLVSAIPPYIGLIAAVLYRDEYEETYRRCPTCGKVVALHDALCTRCGTELQFPGTVAAPVEPAAR